MKNNIFKYIFIMGFIIFLIVIYAVFYNKAEVKENVDQTSIKTTIITNMRIGIADFDTLNPIVSNNKNVKEISRLVFDSLVTINENFKLEYVLATEIAKTDNLTYVIKLRENVFWHDGTKFSASDVKFTIDKIKNSEGFSSTYNSNLKYVSGLEIIDSNTLKIMLSQEVEFFEYKLTFPILNEAYYANEDFINTIKNDTVIGTGKFYISEAANNKVKLSKNLNYWNIENENPMLEEIEITVYNTIGEIYTDFKSGYIDVMDVKVSNIEDYIGNLGYNKVEYYTRNVNFLAFNITKNDILSDNKVRKAIDYMLDRDNIISNIGTGFTVSEFLFSPNHWLYNNKLEVQYNAEEANKLLQEAGYTYINNTWEKNGKILEFTITVNENRYDRVQAANNLAAQLANHGIKVNVNVLSNDSFKSVLNNKNYEVILCGIETEFTPKLSTLLGSGNIANYNNEKINEILNVIKNGVDDNTLIEKYNEIYNVYLEEMPYIFLYRETDYMIYNQTLCGTLNPNSFSIFHNVEKWYRK